jgi:two-component system, chemotaxis family, protein-glutamate methylesterase/glutaminase
LVKVNRQHQCELIVIGASSGGLKALMHILSGINASFSIPIIIVLHQLKNSSGRLLEIFQSITNLNIREPLDKEKIESGNVYIAPPDYHILIESNKVISYSYSETVNFSRPSIDVLFETAAVVYKENLAGILLTGANSDGAKGMQCISLNNGFTIIQDPDCAEMPLMPKAALSLVKPDIISPLQKISSIINSLEYGIKTTVYSQ